MLSSISWTRSLLVRCYPVYYAAAEVRLVALLDHASQFFVGVKGDELNAREPLRLQVCKECSPRLARSGKTDLEPENLPVALLADPHGNH